MFTIMKVFLVTISFIVLTQLKPTQAQTGRIIGGFDANIRGYPFVASINVQTSNSKFFCGGTLYGLDWIITAAQCAANATLFTVSLGSATLDGTDSNRVTVATSEFFLHPEFNSLTLENDIAVIKLRMPITHTDYIKSIGQLPTADVTMGVQVYALGWGQISDSDASLSNKLKVGYVVPITNDECKSTYGSQITDNMVCVSGNYNEGICHGDTGGPLIETLRTGVSILVGVASFMSSNGCESTDPSGFTRTFSYVEWIHSVTNASVL